MNLRIEKYFSLNEILLLTLCGALIFVLKVIFKLPIHLPGHSGAFWVIPLIIGVSFVKKPGSGLYIGLVSGLLASFFGIGALHVFDLVKYLSIGAATDLFAVLFAYRFDNVAVAVITGIFANVIKMLVNYSIQLVLGVQPFFIILGIGVSSVTHIVFGAIGGLISAFIIQRLIRAGLVGENNESSSDFS
ncbi:ECF transporter S component [Methanoplanus endosymbiosus]|uniref:ECF transporter S component n=1 Tax=Methanoplanus endosymbiosus TaxID=33865 RepID=A0A9E7PQB3_9EURY|nr:ECF transporter S component [Methanoplanus endosymbiosus]UUX91582.1 ECF transporter S component [Methanoplanus endosymbiosus]